MHRVARSIRNASLSRGTSKMRKYATEIRIQGHQLDPTPGDETEVKVVGEIQGPGIRRTDPNFNSRLVVEKTSICELTGIPRWIPDRFARNAFSCCSDRTAPAPPPDSARIRLNPSVGVRLK